MFTIGEFSKLCFVSARMLRHYDLIDLLHPCKIDKENGYRYYDISQLPTLRRIEQLKKYEFSLEEIRTFLTLSQIEQTKLLELQLQELRRKKQLYENIIRDMEHTLEHKEEIPMNNYHVITMNQKSQNVLFIPKTIHVCSADFHKLAKELADTMKEQHLTQTGPVQICYLDEEFNPDSANIEMQVEVTGKGENIRTLPETLYVTVMHTGPMEHIKKAYESIMTWLSIHTEYEICGPSIERLICDESMVSDPSKLQTAVMFPIQSK